MARRKGSQAELDARRQWALERLEEGLPVDLVARLVDRDPRTVRDWRDALAPDDERTTLSRLPQDLPATRLLEAAAVVATGHVVIFDHEIGPNERPLLASVEAAVVFGVEAGFERRVWASRRRESAGGMRPARRDLPAGRYLRALRRRMDLGAIRRALWVSVGRAPSSRTWRSWTSGERRLPRAVVRALCVEFPPLERLGQSDFDRLYWERRGMGHAPGSRSLAYERRGGSLRGQDFRFHARPPRAQWTRRGGLNRRACAEAV